MAETIQPTAPSIEAHAMARHVRMSPQKARLVIDLIRGRSVNDALQTLRYTPKRAAKHIEKVLRSAVANAERKAEDDGAPLDVDELYVAKCFVNEGPRWKRLRPARWAAPSATRSAPRTFGSVSPSTMSPPPSGMPPTSPKPKLRRARAALCAAFARLLPASSSRQRRERSNLWDRRFILTVSALATTSPGSRVGMPAASTPTCSTKT